MDYNKRLDIERASMMIVALEKIDFSDKTLKLALETKLAKLLLSENEDTPTQTSIDETL